MSNILVAARAIAETPLKAAVREELVRRIMDELESQDAKAFEMIALGLASE